MMTWFRSIMKESPSENIGFEQFMAFAPVIMPFAELDSVITEDDVPRLLALAARHRVLGAQKDRTRKLWRARNLRRSAR
jgi:hypothetical protein